MQNSSENFIVGILNISSALERKLITENLIFYTLYQFKWITFIC